MPSVSKAQQRLFGFLDAHPDEAKKRGIAPEVVKEFASTKTAGLPDHVQHSEAQFRHRDSNVKHPHAREPRKVLR